MPTPSPSRFYALVPCAGIGERAGTAGPKQYAVLAGGTVVGHTLRALAGGDRLQGVREARVAATVDRAGKWQAQTPQMFRLGLLREALAKAGPQVTDEASAIEALGRAPKLVRGAFENFKLTFPADFELAERLLRTRR